MTLSGKAKMLRLDSIQTKPFKALVNQVMAAGNSLRATSSLLGVSHATITNLLKDDMLTFKSATRLLAGYKKWKQSLPSSDVS